MTIKLPKRFRNLLKGIIELYFSPDLPDTYFGPEKYTTMIMK
jgi:hypothetical protein